MQRRPIMRDVPYANDKFTSQQQPVASTVHRSAYMRIVFNYSIEASSLYLMCSQSFSLRSDSKVRNPASSEAKLRHQRNLLSCLIIRGTVKCLRVMCRNFTLLSRGFPTIHQRFSLFPRSCNHRGALNLSCPFLATTRIYVYCSATSKGDLS